MGHRTPAPAHLQLHPAPLLLPSLPGFWSALTAQSGPCLSHLITYPLIFSRYLSLEATSLLISEGQLTAGIPPENTARLPGYHLSDLGRATSAFQTQQKWGARQFAVRRAEKITTAGFPLKTSVLSDSGLMPQEKKKSPIQPFLGNHLPAQGCPSWYLPLNFKYLRNTQRS